MSRHSDKLNIIDQGTYQILKKDNGNSTPKVLRSAKYKNKHKREQQCTLLDFLVVPRQKQKQINKRRRPQLVARKCVALQTKRKGKTRLHPKRRIARLKRIIRKYRNWKQHKDEDNNYVEPLQQALDPMSVSHESASENMLQAPLSEKLQKLTLGETEKRCTLEVESSLSASVQLKEIQRLTLNNVEPNTLGVITNLRCLSLNDAVSGQPASSTNQIHSRRFRSYCDNCTTPRLKDLTTQLLNDLDRFQKRAYAHNEIKARAHPRLVVGFRESLSRLRINKVKLLILAPDCEICPAPGGLDDTIDELKLVCQQQRVPYCFSLMRRELAYALRKRAQISCVAVLDYDGANETYKQLLQELDVASYQYKCLTAT
ncbi:selenocysteine insertion sequence-binding protein 2 [Drosophila novamexicana]|uniref:selenocysteine insertion sequence-binding protein 2 n=1 Tax=Drosophila novamexicana TaxID=47314 RepID=UPI0011E5BACF|nr:selenocysteine insertion sequence-binding protein 2 [Drosophila novamexicana]